MICTLIFIVPAIPSFHCNMIVFVIANTYLRSSMVLESLLFYRKLRFLFSVKLCVTVFLVTSWNDWFDLLSIILCRYVYHTVGGFKSILLTMIYLIAMHVTDSMNWTFWHCTILISFTRFNVFNSNLCVDCRVSCASLHVYVGILWCHRRQVSYCGMWCAWL